MDVFALIGPSGTGKSHRASVVAYDQNVDLIIDDGLVIKETKILAGKSAKREPTLVAAVRRALFLEEDHAAEVKSKIGEINPARVLILGTSKNMVNRIADTLELPRPGRYIAIEEVASPWEIRKARRIRREQGKHVIPAPTFEVKKTFSGYMVDPLRFLLKRKTDPTSELMVEKSVVRPTFSSLGRFYIADVVVSAIATRAGEEVEGVTRIIRTVVETSPEGVVITLEVVLRFGGKLVPIMEEVQRRIKAMVEHMTALNVLEVNVEARRLSLD
ncbi:MAG: Asp23/Gls24 family envelope stress response protein [Actinobacteria bacterium]|nr:Asp23/Gls24 family envelope stress response protein [Actinomycetota bacterium]